jgi:hypothetical protein
VVLPPVFHQAPALCNLEYSEDVNILLQEMIGKVCVCVCVCGVCVYGEGVLGSNCGPQITITLLKTVKIYQLLVRRYRVHIIKGVI